MKCPTDLQLLPLHTHTSYSVLDGASDIDEYIAWCKENGATALGVTDHGWVIGALELHQKCKKAGLASLPGCEFYVRPEPGYEFAKKPYDYYHVTAWAVSEAGYRNLIKLGSISFTDTFKDGEKRVVKKVGVGKPRITFDELLEYNEGLVLGSGCLIGAINKALLQGEYDGAEKNLLRLLEVYRGRFYIEIMPHHCTHDYHRPTKSFIHNECTDFAPNGDIQRACNIRNIEIAKRHKLPLLLTVDSHFVKPDQKGVQDVLLQNGDPDGWRFYNSYHMLRTEEAWTHWERVYGSDEDSCSTFIEAVQANHEIAEKAKGFQIKDRYHQPEITLPQDLQVTPLSEAEKLKVLLLRKIDQNGRMKWDDKKYTERLHKELAVICDNGINDFSRYFLFLEAWSDWTREHSILSAPGRGSGAGSLLCYLLKITHLNPFDLGLPFERFLSMGRLKRGKFPDIDWDLGQRDLLIAKLSETYGDRFAQCSTHGTLKVKSAIKDACRVLLGWNSSHPEVEKVTKSIPNTPTGVDDEKFLVGYTDPETGHHEGHIDSNPLLREFFENNPEVFKMVLKLLGIPRSVGRHASAYFISDRPIWESVPTCTVGGNVVTQYTAKPSEAAGLIKFDLLRVNTLSDISGCVRLIQQRMGHKVQRERIAIKGESFDIWRGDLGVDQVPMPDGKILDIYQLPPDPAVFADFEAGKTETVFQMNTPLLTAFCKRIKPRSLKDLSAIVALVRPGPLTADTGIPQLDENGLKSPFGTGNYTMTEAFIARRDGKLSTTYVHPGLEPILSETHGVAVYQEQLQQIFSDLAGYSPEEADAMRELIAKKLKDEMEKAVPEIKGRLKKCGWTDEQIHVLISLCEASASYSFNKAHSASYATVAYQCMFLKHHYPLEWWTAVLQNAKVEDIRDRGYAYAIKEILVLPHVNGPMDTFELRDGKVHAPLYLIEGVGDSSCRTIRNEREKNGEFKTFQDFYERVAGASVDLKVMHALILCGAFHQICPLQPKDLLFFYHAFRRVQELKIGRGKKGKDLLDAIEQYVASGKKIDVPDLYMDQVELEVLRLKLLPIYRMDVHEHFKETLKLNRFLYDSMGNITSNIDNETVRVLRSVKEIPSLKSATVGWVGLLQTAEEFRYKDKKTSQQVTALKCQIVNDGDGLECILWPNYYAVSGAPKDTKLIFAKGILKESREPGKWALYVQSLKQF
jgi:DNA polymerase-3 subunit alpha